jgi:signal transduction histidine kinase
MRLGTRLLLPLLATVVAVMALSGWWSQRQREVTLTEEARRETNAYAVALGLALDAATRSGSRADLQALIDRVSREPTIYGVVVYDTAARVLLVSETVDTLRTAPLQSVQKVLQTGAREVLLRDFEGERVYSVVRPLTREERIVGAFEVAQPLSFVEAERQRTRERYALNSLFLVVLLTILILWLVRRQVGTPLRRLVTGVRALGSGELAYRIETAGPGELAELAREFNQMADRLESARARLEAEAGERAALDRRLREAEKMAALGTLAAGLAHEIAAPLHVIRGRAEMMLKREPEPGQRERNLRIISDQIGRITNIVRNLLDYARRREPRTIAVAVDPLLDDVLEFLAAELANDHVHIRRAGAPDIAVTGDPDLLHQVLINLLLNAVQALRSRTGERIIELNVEITADGQAQILVADNAGGIDPALVTRIFDPFVTTKTADSGTGLGLAVARSIIEEHGGTIDVYNADNSGGRGACFRIILPRADAPGVLHE